MADENSSRESERQERALQSAYEGLAPGWYRDPTNPTVARYWDGRVLGPERRLDSITSSSSAPESPATEAGRDLMLAASGVAPDEVPNEAGPESAAFCDRCGAAHAATSRFCPWCGSPRRGLVSQAASGRRPPGARAQARNRRSPARPAGNRPRPGGRGQAGRPGPLRRPVRPTGRASYPPPWRRGARAESVIAYILVPLLAVVAIALFLVLQSGSPSSSYQDGYSAGAAGYTLISAGGNAQQFCQQYEQQGLPQGDNLALWVQGCVDGVHSLTGSQTTVAASP